MTKFETAVLNEVARIREQLSNHDLPQFTFEVEASGRVLEGEVKIKFKLKGDYFDTEVKGSSVDEVIREFCRRKGWNDRNDGLLLPGPKVEEEQEKVSEEIPY